MKDVYKNLILATISLISFLLVGELLLRIIESKNSGKFERRCAGLMEYQMIPNTHGTILGTKVSINSQGLRDYEYSIEKPQNSFRIIAIGDSFTFGYGVELEDTFPKQLEKLLNEDGSIYFEVINAGVCGYDTIQELSFLKERLLKYKPHLIILGYNLLDVLDNERSQSYSLIAQYIFLNKSYLFRYLSPKINFLLRRLHIGIGPLEYMEKYVYPNFEKWPKTQQALKEISHISSAADTETIVVIFPILVSLNDRYPSKNSHNAIIDFCNKNDIKVLDLLPYFLAKDPKKLRATILDGHPNKMAFSLASQAIYKFIKKEIFEE